MDNVYCIVSLTGRISQPTQRKTLREPLVYNNMMAHCLRFHVLNDNGSPADLTGVGVTGDFTVSGHDSILPILGTVSGNTAELILPAPCYAYAGRYTAHMNLTKNGQTRTVMTVDGFVERNTTDAIVDPGTPVSNIETAINGANAAAAAANASVAQANAALDTATQAAARANAGADNLESTRQSLLQEVTDLKSALKSRLDFLALEQGSFNTGSGNPTASTKIVRTISKIVDPMHIDTGSDAIRISMAFAYNLTDDSFISYSVISSRSADISPASGTYIKLIFNRYDNTNLKPEDIQPNMTITGLILSQTDTVNNTNTLKINKDKTAQFYKSSFINTSYSAGTIISPTMSVSNALDCIIVPCQKGDVFTLTGVGGSSGRLWCFTDVNYRSISIAASGESANNLELTAPVNGYFISNVIKTNAYSLSVLQRITAAESIEKRYKIKQEGSKIKIKCKCGEKDLMIVLDRVGGNSLYNFDKIYLFKNPSYIISDDFSETSDDIVYTKNCAVSDWIGPYKLTADNNADGDTPTNNYFTGGFHRTTNTATGGGATGSQLSSSVLVDGVIPSDGVIYRANEITVKWKNGINAYNTSKADGTGRNVITEEWTMQFDDKVYVKNSITALEDCHIVIYYGLQMTTDSGDSMRFVGGADRGIFANSDSANSGNKTCRTVNASNVNLQFALHIGDEDLGLFGFNNADYSILKSSGKVYSVLVSAKHLALSENDTAYLSGWYEFIA